MTSYAHTHPHHPLTPRAVPAPTLEEWTAAHALHNPNRRRVALTLLHDRLVASRMAPWEAQLFLKRHVIGFAFRWLLMGAFAWWISPWMWVPIVAIPLFGLARMWRDG